ncbi:C2H2-type zinc finger protein [Halomarina salina]|uniref:C2H2-type zinc finger protein n=1 Tax=Halomarina salina TaxID=1872699 RepID=A0ABD5RQI7_9EURY|nr:C2H2-type zinc finger protein [Halomarina salina]
MTTDPRDDRPHDQSDAPYPSDSTDSTDTTTTPPGPAASLASLPTEVPADADPVRCQYCDQPFPTDRLHALHLGECHADLLTPEETAAYEENEDAEVDDLFVYHLKVVALLVVVVMGLSYVYAFALA